MTAPTIEKLPVRIFGRALAALEAKHPQHVEDAPLTATEIVAIIADFRAAGRCPDCEGIVLDGHTHTAPAAAHWVSIDPSRFGALTSHTHSLWTDYVTHQPVQHLDCGWLRVDCPSAAAATHLRELLLGYGLPNAAVWTGSAS